jgi:type II secretory pathway component PulC
MNGNILMNSKVIKLLLGLCLLMLVILLIEFGLSLGDQSQFDKPITASEKQQVESNDLPELNVAKQELESYNDMVESPLFIEGRKPIAEIEEEKPVEQVSKIDDLTLLGIYSVKGHMTAMFNKAGKDKKYLKKSEGDDVSGWTLQEIKSDKVVLERTGKKQTVMLRKPKAKMPKLTPMIKSKSRAMRKPKSRKKPMPTAIPADLIKQLKSREVK